MIKYDKDKVRYPAVYDNKDGVTDEKKWEMREFDYTQYRVYELYVQPSLIKQTFDGKHLMALHKYLFQDCYPWAGKLRDNGGQTNPASWSKTKKIDGIDYISIYTADSYILNRMDEIQGILSKTGFPKEKEDVLELVATLSDRINEIHPFREGNSRTKRVFVRQVAERCGHDLDFSQLDIAGLTNGEFVVNSINANGKNCALSDKERVNALKELYRPALSIKKMEKPAISNALQEMCATAPPFAKEDKEPSAMVSKKEDFLE